MVLAALDDRVSQVSTLAWHRAADFTISKQGILHTELARKESLSLLTAKAGTGGIPRVHGGDCQPLLRG